MARQLLLLLVSVALSSVRAWPLESPYKPPYEVVLTGSCDVKRHLDGLVFRWEGLTLSGAPFYKAVDEEQYIFYDPDCPGSTDGTPRWIIDSDRPNVNAAGDLDGDRACQYHARINSKDPSHPPMYGEWVMECQDGWRGQILILLPVSSTTTTATMSTTTTNTKTSTTRTTTAKTVLTTADPNVAAETPPCATSNAAPMLTEDSTTLPPPTMPPAPGRFVLVLDCPCETKNHLNGLVFGFQGRTADGAPYYKAHGVEEYIYHDIDCDGPDESEATASAAIPRWILDADRPLLDRPDGDVDGDGRCDYHARFDSAEEGAARPPSTGTWQMFCGGVARWKPVKITLREVNETVVPKTQSEVPVFVSGAPGPRGLLSLLLVPLLAVAIGA